MLGKECKSISTVIRSISICAVRGNFGPANRIFGHRHQQQQQHQQLHPQQFTIASNTIVLKSRTLTQLPATLLKRFDGAKTTNERFLDFDRNTDELGEHDCCGSCLASLGV